MKRIFSLILIMLLIASQSFAGVWTKATPADSDAWVDFPTDQQANNDAIDRVLSNYRRGMKLKYSDGSTVVAQAGEIVVSNSAGTVRIFLNNTSDSNITFASNLDTGSESGATTYYVYAIAANTSSETATFKISESSTCSGVNGGTYCQRIGSFYNNASSNMEQIYNDNESVIVSTGTTPHGGTITVPSGYSADECAWTVGVGDIDDIASGGAIDEITATVSSTTRVVTCTYNETNWVDSGSNTAGTCTVNHIIACHR